MKSVAVNLQDLIDILEAMRDSGGTTEIVLFERKGMLAICDREQPEDIITFQSFDKTEETKDGDKVH